MQFQFAFIYAFLLLPIPFLVRRFLPAVKNIYGDAINFPFMDMVKQADKKTYKNAGSVKSKNKLMMFLLSLVWLLLIVSFARPQYVGDMSNVKKHGRDIMLVLDLSESMLIEDFAYNGTRVNRLNAVKVVANEFIDKRIEDRIGLVLFGSRAYLQSPLTFDRDSVKKIISEMEAGFAGRKTAIGDALALSVKYVKEFDEKNRVVIFLTDGMSNYGKFTPEKALKLAVNEKVKIYTIGVGATEMRVKSFFGSRKVNPSRELDEKTLKKIAEKTGGDYYRAKDLSELKGIYSRIDELEAVVSQDNMVRPKKELFYIPLLLAMLVTFLMFLTNVIYRKRVLG